MKKIAEYRFFAVMQDQLRPGRKTHEYYLVNHRSGSNIGKISWYASWRQFCFFPYRDSVWSHDCLTSVQHFMDRLKVEGEDAVGERCVATRGKPRVEDPAKN